MSRQITETVENLNMNVDLTPDAMQRDTGKPSRQKTKKEKKSKAIVDHIDSNYAISKQNSEDNTPAQSER